jgi:uncharacterized membrane protein YfcA
LLYPQFPTARIVGRDIAQAVPLTLVAGLGHGAMGSLDAIPGVFAGSSLSARVPDAGLRHALAVVLFVVGAKFSIDMNVRSVPNVTPATSTFAR